MKREQLIEVTWVDPALNMGMQAEPETLSASMAKSVGYFVNMDENYIRLAHTNYGAEGFADVLVIPMGLMIGKPRVLK